MLYSFHGALHGEADVDLCTSLRKEMTKGLNWSLVIILPAISKVTMVTLWITQCIKVDSSCSLTEVLHKKVRAFTRLTFINPLRSKCRYAGYFFSLKVKEKEKPCLQ